MNKETTMFDDGVWANDAKASTAWVPKLVVAGPDKLTSQGGAENGTAENGTAENFTAENGVWQDGPQPWYEEISTTSSAFISTYWSTISIAVLGGLVVCLCLTALCLLCTPPGSASERHSGRRQHQPPRDPSTSMDRSGSSNQRTSPNTKLDELRRQFITEDVKPRVHNQHYLPSLGSNRDSQVMHGSFSTTPITLGPTPELQGSPYRPSMTSPSAPQPGRQQASPHTLRGSAASSAAPMSFADIGPDANHMMGRMASPDRRSPDRRMGSPDPHPLVLPMPPPSPKLRSPGSQARSPEGRSPGRLQAEGPSFEHGREPQAWSMSGGTPSLGPQEYPTRNSRTSSQTPEARVDGSWKPSQ